MFGCRRQRLAALFSLVALPLCLTTPTWANTDRVAARAIGGQGVEAYQAGDFETAHEKLETAYKVLQVPSLALWSARALRKKGLYVEAAERYLEATRLPVDGGGNADIQKKAQADASAEREELLPLIPTLQVEVENVQGDDPIAISVNGKGINPALIGSAVPTNPGETTVMVAQGQRSAEAKTTLEESKPGSVTIKLPAPTAAPVVAPDTTSEPEASPEPKEEPAVLEPASSTDQPDPTADPETGGAQRTVGWISFAVGGAALLAGGGTGVGALALYEGLDCPNDTCTDSDDEGTVNTINTLRTVSTVSLIAGGVLAVTGISLVLTAPKNDDVSFAPYIGDLSAGVRGTF